MAEMTEKEAFALGFLDELAERGIPPHLILAAPTEKSASLAQMAGALGDWGLLGLATGIGAPLLVGSVAGRALGAAGDVDKADVSEAQAEELSSMYEHEADRLRRIQAHRANQAAVSRTGRPFV